MRIRSFLVVLGWIWFSVAANAQKYAVTVRIPFGGEQTYWDYLLADAPSHRLYVTRGNEVLILDLSSAKELACIQNLKRVHGIALARELHKGFISDGGDNAVVVFDLKSNSVTQAIKVGNAPDAVLYEPAKKRIYAFNAHSHNASVIDAVTEKIVATVPLSGIPEFAATDGKGNVFVNIESKNSLVRFDADTGKQIAQIPVGVEPDAAIYDAERKLVFASNCDGTLTVVKQESPDKYTVVQTLKTEKEARTMALDPVSGRIYLPYEEVKPGSKPPDPGNLPEFTPGTFRLMIVAKQM
jgi:YVTN family beta-propeller protein